MSQLLVPSRRLFLSLSAGVVSWAALSSASAWGASDPRDPRAPKHPGSGNTNPEKLPEINAPSERAGSPMQPLPPDQRVGYAIVGLGHLSLEQILPAFAQSQLSKPVALVSGDRKKAERIAKAYGVPTSGLYSYDEFEKMKENKDIQVVYIVLPNSLHKEFTVRAAEAGKHVLCEKPMTTTVSDAEAMIAACRKAQRKLMIAYRQQYEPNNRRNQEILRTKIFGALKLFDASNVQNQAGKKGGAQQWRHIRALAGGGALPDIGLYCLNAARFLSGEEPYEVSGLTFSTPHDPRFTEVEETVSWQMRFPSGLIANLSASYGAHQSRRYRAFAETGWLGMDPSFDYRGLQTELSYATANVEHRERPLIEEQNQFALEMDHMSDCVMNDKEPLTPGEEGLQDQKIMAAIYESAQTRRPVALERIEGLDVFRHPGSLR